NLVNKFEAFLLVLAGPDFEHNIGKFTATTRLFLVDLLMINILGECFLVSNLGSALVNLYLEFTSESVDNNLEVQFTHTAEDGLTGLLVGMHTKSRILFDEFSDSHAELVSVGLFLRFNSVADNGLGEDHRFENNLALLVAKSISGFDILKSDDRSDITCLEAFDLVLLIRVHLEDTRDTLLVARPRIVHIRARLKNSGVSANEAQTTYERIRCNLKCEGSKRLLRIGLQHYIGVRVRIVSDDIVLVKR